MNRLVFLLEEPSMKVFLEGLLPRLFPGLPFLCIPHEGKQDLEASIPRKLRAWREPGVRFIVVRDNDSADCRALKAALASLCQQEGRRDAMIRIACQELEAWYLGDPGALAEAFQDEALRNLGAQSRFRNPDAVRQPSRALAQLVPSFQKVSGARRLARHMVRERNTSRSFHALLNGVESLAKTLQP
jgi:hypothetical protein